MIKTAKIILIVPAILIALLLLLLTGLYLVPPPAHKPVYPVPVSYTTPGYDAVVGLYRASDTGMIQVTWSAKGGLRLNRFGWKREHLRSIQLNPISTTEFDSDGDPTTVEVAFTRNRDDGGWILEAESNGLRLQADQIPDPPYSQREVRYSSGALMLTATLSLPANPAPAPAVVMIHGSGFSDRDNLWYSHQAHYLATQGIMVLAPDKRGSGKSGGEWHDASFADLAGDVTAGVNYLIRHHGGRITIPGVVGLSQGGWISYMAAEGSEDIAFIVDVVNSATTPNRQVHFEVKQDIIARGIPVFLAEPLAFVYAHRARMRRRQWWRKNGDFDPLPYVQTSRIPILKILAADDTNVPVKQSLQRLEELNRRHPGVPITVKVFRNSGHGLFDPQTGWIREDYLKMAAAWIKKVEPGTGQSPPLLPAL